jgi:hypothetical protein
MNHEPTQLCYAITLLTPYVTLTVYSGYPTTLRFFSLIDIYAYASMSLLYVYGLFVSRYVHAMLEPWVLRVPEIELCVFSAYRKYTKIV